jgi:hypothetical protein
MWPVSSKTTVAGIRRATILQKMQGLAVATVRCLTLVIQGVKGVIRGHRDCVRYGRGTMDQRRTQKRNRRGYRTSPQAHTSSACNTAWRCTRFRTRGCSRAEGNPRQQSHRPFQYSPCSSRRPNARHRLQPGTRPEPQERHPQQPVRRKRVPKIVERSPFTAEGCW